MQRHMADQYRDKPYQTDDDAGYDAAPKRPASDPLAELARLIGQADPFSKYNRPDQQPAPTDQDGIDEAAAYYDEPVQQPSWMRNRPPAQDAVYGDEQSFEPRHHDDQYREDDRAPRFQQQSFDQDRQHGADPSRYDDVLFGQPDHNTRHDAPFQAQNDRYSDDRFDRPHFDEDHDEMPAPRRGGTMTVVVVLLLAVVGTAAAFGYRTFIGSPRSGEPPVIKADAGPNKVMSSSGDKQITDRIGDKSGERVVSREEQPVDVNGKAQPRVVFPPLSQNANPPNASSANTAVRPTGAGVGNGTVSTGGEEPRKIRTLTIRPDQPDATASAAPAPTPQPQAPRVSAPTPPTAAPRVTQTAPASTGNGPIALTPQAAPAVEARPKVASISPSTSNGSGSYVQVSSQKTEADAQASFRAIQSKYSEVLGSKQSTIRRADLGEKGVFYRALVGPFGTTDEAATFCVNLKAAGGQCIVQRN
jgi:hypothetical protein